MARAYDRKRGEDGTVKKAQKTKTQIGTCMGLKGLEGDEGTLKMWGVDKADILVRPHAASNVE